MIQKLRRKFVMVIMSVVTVLIAAAFIGILISTNNSLERQSQFELKMALANPNTGQPSNTPTDRRKPFTTVLIDEHGSILSMSNNIFGFADDSVATITKLALASGEERGVLREYNLRFLIEKLELGKTRLAFIDNTMENTIIEKLLLNSGLVVAFTLLLFFGISIFLARWVVLPIEKAWNSQRQFVADASHELKTPLTVILSNVEMLTGDISNQDTKTKTRLENIHEEAKQMKVLVDDLLYLARTDSIRRKGAFEKVNFSMLLSKATLIFEPILFDTGKRFEYTIKDNLFVMGNVCMLRQLTEILLDNALRYSTPAGLINVVLKSGNKNDIIFEITNDSEPIPQEELSKIFERFYRLDKSRSSSGYGLGLAIAETIVSEHSGKISANSEASHITFCVALPATR